MEVVNVSTGAQEALEVERHCDVCFSFYTAEEQQKLT